jgi:alcohol/geraniol dehydrogenase (NADP+)
MHFWNANCRSARCTPQTEHFPMSRINEAFARLASGKARYRTVLDADF